MDNVVISNIHCLQNAHLPHEKFIYLFIIFTVIPLELQQQKPTNKQNNKNTNNTTN